MGSGKPVLSSCERISRVRVFGRYKVSKMSGVKIEAVFFAAGPDYDPVLPINNERALVQADEDGGVDGAGAASSPTRSSGSERERQ